ncbi:DUF1353 domain-containing protein [Vibrio mangrovi]|uniref:DUF1353 domain-containing protein n=1 Tax=Vibrio mangrovi TaxID=474394 RepID=A0A1Y6IWV9_9VIBR|nr:DUF1353 domain-containing protein [Vibrio mangrovi]MDW6005423.1 DUF1353 domain-containing protein [Vibrio mangrovi]SMS02137.1 hypothetical protein VIM7927_03455 [Vibrio mangrovi]
MSNLTLFPIVEPHASKLDEAYEVAEDFGVVHQEQAIWVPKFFQYDGASIPSAAYGIIGTPFNPRFMKAAVVHDWLYYTHMLSRSDADQLFYELLRESGVRKIKAVLMREAVEGFGHFYWDNDEDDTEYLSELAGMIQNDGREPSKYGL